jgi:hypothetical protein
MSRFSPHVSTRDVANSLMEQLKRSSTDRTTVKTQFNTHASLDIFVREKDFSLICRTGYGLTGIQSHHIIAVLTPTKFFVGFSSHAYNLVAWYGQ